MRRVAQGLILGVLIYTIYTCRLPRYLKLCKIHMHVNDRQIYTFFKLTSELKKCKNLVIIIDEKLMIIFNTQLKLQFYDSLVLSWANYSDYVYGSCHTSKDAYSMQKLRNSWLRLAYGIRKLEKIFYTLEQVNWLNMEIKCKLLAQLLVNKIVTNIFMKTFLSGLIVMV